MSDDPCDEAAASDAAACPLSDPTAPSHSGDIRGLDGPDTLPPRGARRAPKARARLLDAARQLGDLPDGVGHATENQPRVDDER